MAPKLTLGPIPFHWTPEKKLDFYHRIADEAPVDTVYLGEVICSKRAPFFDDHYGHVAERLQKGGKTVVFSSLAEVMLKRERKGIEDLCSSEILDVEINNVAGLFHNSGRPHRIGPFMNVYNEETLSYFASKGAKHVCLPAEMPGRAIGVLTSKALDMGVDVEVQVFGRAPLAMSARCYHARAHGRTKDNCQFVCESDPDGMQLKTLDDQAFLHINGIQTLSNSYVNLAAELPSLTKMGVSHFRLMPQDVDMVETAKVFSDLILGKKEFDKSMQRLKALSSGTEFSNGFWYGKPGYQYIGAEMSQT